MRYPNAKHQNMGGVTHSVPSVQELLHKVKQAGDNRPLEYSTDISQAMRDTLCPDGPSPAIVFRDNTHWRVMLINAKRKHADFIDPFGTGFLHSVRTSIQSFFTRDKSGTGTFTEWTKRLQARGDSWKCGVWAIYIQEKWMQYWSQTEATEAFADWLQQDVDMIPEGQDFRQHYHVVMQIAGTAGEDGMTDPYKSREIRASRMANHRDKQDLYETYKACMHKGAKNESGSRGNIPSKQTVAAKLRCRKAIRKRSSTSHNKRSSQHQESKCKCTAKKWMKVWQQQGLNSQPDAHEQQHKSNVETTQRGHDEKSKLGHNKKRPLDGSTQAHRPGSKEACLAAAQKKSAPKEQPVPGTAHNEHNQPRAHKTHTPSSGEAANLKQNENDLHSHSDLCRVLKREQASAASDKHIYSAANSTAESMTRYVVTPSKKPPGQEKKKKTAGVYTPYCDHMTILTWNMMGSATIPDELREIADQKKPWVIVMTETELTDIKQDRVFVEPYLPKYKLYHSCGKGHISGHCRTGSGGVTVAVHNSFTTQKSIETISHNHPAAKAHLKTLKIKPPGSDCLTIWGVYLPNNDMPKIIYRKRAKGQA